MGFIYNGISSKNMKIRARLTGWQASPSLRNSYETVPGRAGVADFGCDSSERVISISCNIYPQLNFASMVHLLDNMAEWLDPMQGLRQLVLDDVPDRYFMARLSEAVDCERLLRTAGAFTLTFICPDPYAYALKDDIFDITSLGIHDVNRVRGNAISEPVYLLRGMVSSQDEDFITLKTNKEELRITGLLSVREILVIDSGLLTAKITDLDGNMLRNGLSILQRPNFPTLNKGTNTVDISVNGATFTELVIHAKSRWR